MACEAVKEGIPSVAFAAATAKKLSYTTLTTSPNSPDTLSALLYADLSANFIHALVDPASRPILPTGVFLRVNYPPTTFFASGKPIGNCAAASDFKWVLTRQQPGNAVSTVETYGSKRLPVDRTVVNGGCYTAVTVLNATTRLDVSADIQAEVLTRIAPSGLLSCFRG